MKRGWISLLLTGAVMAFLIGCSSPMKEAQTMLDQGQYEQLIAKFKDKPEMKAMVQQATDKLVEKLFAEGRYNTILENYKDHRMAKDAMNMLAEKLLAEGRLQDVIAMYPESPAAMKARLQLQQMANDSLAMAADSANKKLGETEKKVKDTQKKVEQAKDEAAEMAERSADNALKSILSMANPTAKKKALESFLKKDEYKNTSAYKKAQEELAKL